MKYGISTFKGKYQVYCIKPGTTSKCYVNTAYKGRYNWTIDYTCGKTFSKEAALRHLSYLEDREKHPHFSYDHIRCYKESGKWNAVYVLDNNNTRKLHYGKCDTKNQAIEMAKTIIDQMNTEREESNV